MPYRKSSVSHDSDLLIKQFGLVFNNGLQREVVVSLALIYFWCIPTCDFDMFSMFLIYFVICCDTFFMYSNLFFWYIFDIFDSFLQLAVIYFWCIPTCVQTWCSRRQQKPGIGWRFLSCNIGKDFANKIKTIFKQPLRIRNVRFGHWCMSQKV